MNPRRYSLSGPSGPHSLHADNRYTDVIAADLKKHLDSPAHIRFDRLPRAVQNALLANIADGLVSTTLIARQLNDPESTLDDLCW